jgi:hypothetical protein
MKKLIPILLLFGSLYFTNNTKAQTTLVAGDIVFTGYHSGTASVDSFSFVFLKAVAAGTVISFTDNGWLNPGNFRGGEQTVTFTTIALPKGTEIIIGGAAGITPRIYPTWASAGSCTGTGLALATAGDQIIAYQGTVASGVLTGTIISAIHFNVYSNDNGDCGGVGGNTTNAQWDPNCIDGGTGTIGTSSFCKLPSGMINGVNAIWIGTEGVGASERDNAKFTACGLDLTTPALVRAAVNDQTNWTISTNTTPPGFTLASGCIFLGSVTAVNLVNFTGKLNANNTTSLQWKIEDHANVDKFCIEKSTDGIAFKPLSTINASLSTTGTYYYTDNNLVAENNYYRIKIIELSGKTFYTNIVSINTKPKVDITIYPNPVVNELVIKQDGVSYSKQVQLLSTTGVVLKQINITSKQHSVNVKELPSGLYYLKISEGKIIKIIKQ